MLHLKGKEEFDGEIENPAFVGSPTIEVHRMTEEDGVVIAEGTGPRRAQGRRRAACGVLRRVRDA